MDLPPVLIGPFLRRVEPRAVSVFVATRDSARIKLTLYEGVVDAEVPPAEFASHSQMTTQFCNAFHAIVVTIELPDVTALQPGHLYSYDVTVTIEGNAQSLKDLQLLADTAEPGYGTQPPASEEVEVGALGYAKNRLPSFVTCPTTLDELVLSHASCRKPHGDGSPALGNLDSYIDDLHGGIEGRPHMLFLTGDQIYADDVATALLPGLSELGIALLGESEQVPSPVAPTNLNVNSSELPAGFRQRVTAKAGFTSEEAASHLIGFGEWLAMYCVAWNPSLWPVLAVGDASDPGIPNAIKTNLEKDAALSDPAAPRVLGPPTPEAPADTLTPLYAGTRESADALAVAQATLLKHKAIIDDFRREVPKVRRLLANVPTYMICDDHEVTDDWFMTGGIRTRTSTNPFGLALLRNALSAYTICQAWGNDPRKWSSENHHEELMGGIASMFTGAWKGGPPQSTASDVVDRELGLLPGAQSGVDFAYTVDGPVHRVRVLNTRTRREYDTPGAPPGLLSQQALDDQLPVEVLPDGHVLVVVSPAPVFGPPVLSDIGGAIMVTGYDLVSMARSETARSAEEEVTGFSGGRPAGLQFFDIEHWGAHPAAYERFLERLSQYPRVVVLAGDVHYGAAYAMDWTAPQATGHPHTSRIVHFTSSAARNAWPGFVRTLIGLNGMATGLQRIGMPMTRLGWSATLPLVVDDVGAEPPLTRIRIRTGPVLLSDEMFRHSHLLQREPEWLWRAKPITDDRPTAKRPAGAQVPEPASDLPDNRSAVHFYPEVAALHLQGLTTAGIARGLQFLNNAGLIRFSFEDDGVHVSQSLYSLRPRPEPNEKGDAYIIHSARLEPEPVPVPMTVGPAG